MEERRATWPVKLPISRPPTEDQYSPGRRFCNPERAANQTPQAPAAGSQKAKKRLTATLPKARFEPTRCKQGRSHFSSSNKNGTFWIWLPSLTAPPTLENLWKLKSRGAQTPGAPPRGHPFELYGTYLWGSVKLILRNRHRSFGGVKCPGRCIMP